MRLKCFSETFFKKLENSFFFIFLFSSYTCLKGTLLRPRDVPLSLKIYPLSVGGTEIGGATTSGLVSAGGFNPRAYRLDVPVLFENGRTTGPPQLESHVRKKAGATLYVPKRHHKGHLARAEMVIAIS